MSQKNEEEGGLMYQSLRKFINIIDELRDLGVSKVIRLPRIAMLGGQSAGKSSVLESIVGLDFLPRGDGVCTRRPLELRLNHLPEGQQPWAKFEELSQKFTNFKEVKASIEFLTDKVCGKTKDIKDVPIVLSVYSPTCPDLTLIDLPGITRIPIEGQAQDIERVTKNMCRHYVTDERTIILCVLPANMDMTLSDGLQMAREVDAKGHRTVGVVTKLDIMDAGTNARNMLEGKEVPMRLGYVGIKNRSQQDIINQVPVKKANEIEQKWFSEHPIYNDMPPGYLGIGTLTKKLTKILFTHIKVNLPFITQEIKEKIKSCEDDLKDLGPPMPSDPQHKIQLLWNMINEFLNTYKNTISGRFDNKRVMNAQNKLGKGQLSGGAKIKESFWRLYQEFSGKVTQDYSDADIQYAIQLHEGDGLAGFPSVDVFTYLISPKLAELKAPALDLVNETYGQLENIANSIVQRVFMRFPGMQNEIMDIIIKALSKERDYTLEIVESLIDSEQFYHFTNDETFRKERSAIVAQDSGPAANQGGHPGQQHPQDGGQDRERFQSVVAQPNMPYSGKGGSMFVQEMRKRIDEYFEIVLRSVRDSVPKAIGYFLVRKSEQSLQFDLYNAAQSNPEMSKFLGEPPNVAERRKGLSEILSTLKNAVKVLQRDPEISANTIGDSELEEDIRRQHMAMARQQNMQRRPAPGQPGPGGPNRNPSLAMSQDQFQQMQNQAQNDPRRTGAGQQQMMGGPGPQGGNPQMRPGQPGPQGQQMQGRPGMPNPMQQQQQMGRPQQSTGNLFGGKPN